MGPAPLFSTFTRLFDGQRTWIENSWPELCTIICFYFPYPKVLSLPTINNRSSLKLSKARRANIFRAMTFSSMYNCVSYLVQMATNRTIYAIKNGELFFLLRETSSQIFLTKILFNFIAHASRDCCMTWHIQCHKNWSYYIIFQQRHPFWSL